MTYEELLRSVTKALPETEGKSGIERVQVCKTNSKTSIDKFRGFSYNKNALILQGRE